MSLASTSLPALLFGSLLALSALACGGRSLSDDSAGVSGSAGSANAGGALSSGGSAAPEETAGSSTSGGAPGSAGDGTLGGLACTAAPACGGDLVGTWSVTSSCLAVSGKLDLSAVGLGCETAPVTGFRRVTGTWSANPDQTYMDGTVTTGIDTFHVPKACLRISGLEIECDRLGPIFSSLGYTSATCAESEGRCACSAKIDQVGGLGLFSADPSTNGTYSVFDNVATMDSQRSYSYCVSGGTLSWSPVAANPNVTGNISFERASR